jgi:TolB protein
MNKRTPHPQSLRTSAVSVLCALVALLVLAIAAKPASAAHPYSGAQIVYVGLEDVIAPEEGFTGFEPVGLRSIRLGESKTKPRALTNEDSGAQPAVSPDGSWIASSRGGMIVLMRLDGSGQRRLTDGGGSSDREPSFAPSGKRILFVRRGDETLPGSNEGDIYSIGTDGSGLRRITSGRTADRSPVFSPNGRQVVFGRTPAGKGFQRLYSARPDGSKLRDLTPRIPARRRAGERNFSAEDPAFSPNGRTIAFTVSNNGGGENIYTMRPNGNRLQSLTGGGEHPLSSRLQLSEPAFSPTGRFLLVTGRDRGHTELAIIDLRDRRRLLNTPLQGEAAVWAP